jgi:hypothetical protein
MISCLPLVLLIGLSSPVRDSSVDARLATLEDQHINQENYNREFDRTNSEKLELMERGTRQAYEQMAEQLRTQAVKIESLRDTQTVALFLAAAAPIILGWAQAWFYFSKGRADRKRSAAIAALQDHVGIKTPPA